MITEDDIKEILQEYELEDEEYESLLNSVKSSLSQRLDFPAEPTQFKQIEDDFNNKKLIVDFFPVLEINSLKIDETIIEDVDYEIDNDLGIIYFKNTHQGFLKLEYVAGLTEEQYNQYITPLLLDMMKYNLSDDTFKDVSSMTEGNVSISYDSNLGQGALIQQKISELNGRFATFLRMI